MGEKLIKPYQISVWEDRFIKSGGKIYHEEVKIAEIGSDTMTSQNRVYSPVFKINTNGEKTLTFSLKYKYYDDLVGDFVVNPFEHFLVNERKIKLFYKNKWHDFVIKEKEENSEDYTFSYTCTDLFVQELARNGYDIVFNTELNNNQGTVTELAAKTLKDTDWTVDEENSDLIQQTVSEPIYICTVGDTSFKALNVDTGVNVTIQSGETIYIFYSYLQNKTTKYVQFLREVDSDSWTYDNNNAIIGTNYRLVKSINYSEFDTNSRLIYSSATIDVGDLNTESQGHRLVYNTLNTYDPVTGQTVDIYQLAHNDGRIQDIYHYTTTYYGTTAILQNYITNGSNYTTSNTGSINGWSNTVYTNANTLLDVGLATYPDTSVAKLAQINELKQMKGYLELEFPNTTGISSAYPYPFFNSGITDNTSLIGGIAGGDKFILRYRYQYSTTKHGNLQKPQLSSLNSSGIRAVVAEYTNVNKTLEDGSTVLVRKINEKKIYIDFTGNFYDGNIHITGGKIINNNYVIDNIIQTPSDKYIYDVVDNTNTTHYYVWDINSSSFEPYRDGDNFTNYYYTIGTAKKSIPEAKLADPANKFGIFIYKKGTAQYVYIEDIEITRYYKDANGNPIFIGSAPESKTEKQDKFYLKPEEGALPNSVDLYSTLESLADTYNFNVEKIKPLKNEKSEKILSIKAEKSNCFNILQDICETFECWMEIDVEHDSIGRIALDENHYPKKKVRFKKYTGKDNFAGFRYGVNLTSITRSVDSNEFVTKLIVGISESEYTTNGVLNIGAAQSNPSGEPYIFNFNYYLNQGLIQNKTAFNQDFNNFNKTLKAKNIEISNLQDDYKATSAALQQLRSTRTVYTEAAEEASDDYSKALADFEKAVGEPYSKFALKKPDIGDNEALRKLVDRVYSTSISVNNYKGLLTNINKEYKTLDLKANGAQTYNITVTTHIPTTAGLLPTTTLITSDYFDGFKCTFTDDGNDPLTARWTSSINDKEFQESTLYTRIIITKIPVNYELEYILNGSTVRTALVSPLSFDITDDGQETTRSFRLVPTKKYAKKYVGLKQQLQDKNQEKEQVEKDFYTKYSRFIQEGTWESSDYISNELYYMDALQVSNTSAQPKVSYTINVLEVSELEGLENYNFEVGDRTYIEDTEFFGWEFYEENGVTVKTPVKEVVVVTEIEWHLDKPDENVITVRNYKDQFEDLFQRITATVQSVEYNQASYMRAASILDSNGRINSSLLVGSLNAIAGQSYNLASNGTLKITDDGIIIRNLTDPRNLLIIKNRGIEKSNNGGLTWENLISPEGVNTEQLTSGSVNTRNITILDGDNPSFRWDSNGISAFGYDEDGSYDLNTFVRFDRYGLYGIQKGANYVASSIEDIKNQADFGLTWDGFFIKNKYNDGYVSISSTDDIQVVANDIERIKIGKFIDTGEYGIRIKNNQDKVVFESNSNGDLTMSGTVRAGAGEIGGFTIDENSLSSGIIGGAHSVLLSPGYKTSIPIAGASEEKNWAITVSSNFAVDTEGHLYATAAYIRGNIYADNGYFSGHIDATSGTFMNELRVGGGDKYIVLQGYADRPDSLIASSDYIDNPSMGWMINGSGDAIFNNVSVRGAIRTAVFEYSEIEAVGGAFLFRPSTSIKEAHISGNDLVLKLEKPNLFQVNEWVKLSNINMESSSTVDVLNSGGLVHIYKVKSTTGKIITLENAAHDFIVGPEEAEYDGWGSVDYGYEPVTFSSEETEVNPHNAGMYELIEGEYVLTQDTEIDEDKTYYYIYYPAYSTVTFGQPDNYVNLTKLNAQEEYEPIVLNAPTYEVYFDGHGYIKNLNFDLRNISGKGTEITFEENHVSRVDELTEESWDYVIQKYLGNLAIFDFSLKDTGEDFLIAQVVETYKATPQSEEQVSRYTRIYSNISHEVSLVVTPHENSNTVNSLEGGSLISFGFYRDAYRPFNVPDWSSPKTLGLYEIINGKYQLTEDTTPQEDKVYYKNEYEGGVHNYGIGINSSDNYVNLPERAISLFETEIHPNSDTGIKVSYNFRGILGTLPTLAYKGANPIVNQLYHDYMEGTQGIYTDNMYIGDKSQYIAFYTDEHGDKHLKISAKEMIFDYDEDEDKDITWEDKMGEISQSNAALITTIHSSVGTSLRGNESAAFVYARTTKGNEEIDPVPIDIQGGTSYPDSPNEGDYFVKLSDSTVPTKDRTARLMKRVGNNWIEQSATCQYTWSFTKANGAALNVVPYQDVNKTKNQFIYINNEIVDKKITINVAVELEN